MLREIENWEPKTININGKSYNVIQLLKKVSRRKNIEIKNHIDKKNKIKNKRPKFYSKDTPEDVWAMACLTLDELSAQYPLLNKTQIKSLRDYARGKCKNNQTVLEWIKRNDKVQWQA